MRKCYNETAKVRFVRKGIFETKKGEKYELFLL